MFTLFLFPGYGRKPGSETLSFVQQKVDIPIFPDRTECNKRLINASSPLKRSGFELHPGDICAGGEEGKDKCDGAGGAPLVCVFTLYHLWSTISCLFTFCS